MKNLYLILGLLFVSFAAVQYNDPDPYIWAPYYLLVAGACFLTYTKDVYKRQGIGIKFSKFVVDYGFANYHLAGSINGLGISYRW